MQTDAPTSNDRETAGREAYTPLQIPRAGWWRILGRTASRFQDQNLALIAAGVGFYSLLGLFPAIAALVTTYGLVFDPAQIQNQFETLQGILPPDVYQLISAQMTSATGQSGGALGLGLAGALLLSFWGATRGTRALIVALNIAYDEHEKRGFLKLNALAFLLTLFLILVLGLAFVATLAVPIVLNLFNLGAVPAALTNWLRWPLMAIIGLLALAILDRYGPSRRGAKWRWLPLGSLVAGVLWLAASVLFSIYVRNFGSYNATYGSIGAVIVMLLWLYLTAVAVIIGAGINAESERQTARDSTLGEPRPRGQRGAVVADRLPGESVD